eukprot:15143616-Alexandrium_andersonii.AAC.1
MDRSHSKLVPALATCAPILQERAEDPSTLEVNSGRQTNSGEIGSSVGIRACLLSDSTGGSALE